MEAERSAVLCIEEAKAGLGGARAGRGAEAHPLQEPQLPRDTWESRLGGDKEEC